MPASRSDGRRALRFLAPLLLLASGVSAAAAGSGTLIGPPAPLGPPQRLTLPPPAAPEVKPAAAPAPIDAKGKPIEVDKLAPIDPNWAGPLGVDQGGFPPNLWQGTPRSFVAALLPRIPVTTSPALQDLTRRLLLSNAVAPGAAGESPSTAGGEPNLVALRLDRLIAAGDVAAARSVLEAVPGHETVEPLERQRAELAFLAGDGKAACERITDDVRRFKDIWWTRALIACQAMAGDQAKAALGLDLLREQKVPRDGTFDALIAAQSGRRGKLDRLSNPTPLELALLSNAKLPLPNEALTAASPALSRAWAQSPNAPDGQRLAAAERAAAFGALPIADLRSLYEKSELTADERASPVSAAGKVKGARGQAILYAAAAAQKQAAARAELLRTMLDAARKDGDFVLVSRLAEPLLIEVPPSGDTAFLAGDAARALLVTGHGDEAKAWLAAADPETVQLLAPVLRLAFADKAPGWNAKRAAETMDALAKSEDEAGPRRAALALSLLGALGEPIGPADWTPLAAKLPLVSLDLPGAPVWFDLPRAAAEKRLGETVLLTLITAGEGDRLSAQPARLVPAVAALRAVGLEKEARALALEAALAGGL